MAGVDHRVLGNECADTFKVAQPIRGMAVGQIRVRAVEDQVTDKNGGRLSRHYPD